MQEWWERFRNILEKSEIEEFLNAIYVDDGRLIVSKLKSGYRFIDGADPKFMFTAEWYKEDCDAKIDHTELTIKEIGKAMNSVSSDLCFTTETHKDFSN